MIFNVTDTNGKSKAYRLKPLDDMTLRDYATLTTPQLAEGMDGYKALLELASRHTTIPRKALDRMPARDVRLMLAKMAEALDEIAKAREEAEASHPGKSFEFKGTTYIIPQNIEAELTFGQYESLDKVLLPQCKSEAEGYACVLAVTCLPDGETFDAAKINERMELFLDLPARTAFGVCSFFTETSEQLRDVFSLIVSNARRSLLQWLEQGLKSTLSTTAA